MLFDKRLHHSITHRVALKSGEPVSLGDVERVGFFAESLPDARALAKEVERTFPQLKGRLQVFSRRTAGSKAC